MAKSLGFYNGDAIYCIKSKHGHGGYVGQTSGQLYKENGQGLYKRFFQHCRAAYVEKDGRSLIDEALGRYGFYSFEYGYFPGPYYGLPEKVINGFKEMFCDGNGQELRDIDVAEILHILYGNKNDKSQIRYNEQMGGKNGGLSYRGAPDIKIALKTYRPELADKIFVSNEKYVQALEIAANKLYQNIFSDDGFQIANEFQDGYALNVKDVRLGDKTKDKTFSQVFSGDILKLVSNRNYSSFFNKGRFDDNLQEQINNILWTEFIQPKAKILRRMFTQFAKAEDNDSVFKMKNFKINELSMYIVGAIKNSLAEINKKIVKDAKEASKDKTLKIDAYISKQLVQEKFKSFSTSITNWSVMGDFRRKAQNIPQWYQDLMSCNLAGEESPEIIKMVKHCSKVNFNYIIEHKMGKPGNLTLQKYYENKDKEITTKENKKIKPFTGLNINVTMLYGMSFADKVKQGYMDSGAEFVSSIPGMSMYRPLVTMWRKDHKLLSLETRLIDDKLAVGYETNVDGEDMFFYWRGSETLMEADDDDMIYY